MANIKIYEMPGCISCRLKFTLGKAQPFEAFFDGGMPDKNYPAVYAARSIGQQLAIENSEYFKFGKIRLRKTKPVPHATVSAPAVSEVAKTDVEQEPAVADGAKVYPEVTTLVDAIGVLKSEYGVSATRLKSAASMLRAAEEKGVSFPNLKL